ncbi:hypothetical protein pb186bvf_002748 [Paramecium bursaria]
MAHLKKFSLAKRLAKLQDTQRKVFGLCCFGTEEGDILNYSAHTIIDRSSQKTRINCLDLEYTTKQFGYPFLTGNMVGLDERIVAMQLDLKQNSWQDVQSGKSLILINPKIVKIEGLVQSEEMNPCVGFVRAIIDRYEEVTVEYQTFDDEKVQNFSGFDAITFQQALDQLNGYTILDPRLNKGRWKLESKYLGKAVKTEQALQYYKDEITKLVLSNPEYFKMRTIQGKRQFGRFFIRRYDVQKIAQICGKGNNFALNG